jgi:DNA-binding response OmpR family regulator
LARVLVVDDDDKTRLGLAELLDQSGHVSEVAGTLQEALLIMGAVPPDLLITDVHLGGASGLDLLSGVPSDVPWIVLTGDSDATLVTHVQQRGGTLVSKPVDAPALLRLVEAILSRRRGDGVPDGV